jgi:hypothetical protein
MHSAGKRAPSCWKCEARRFLSFRAAAQAALGDPFTVAGTAFKVELAERTIVRILHTVSGIRS